MQSCDLCTAKNKFSAQVPHSTRPRGMHERVPKYKAKAFRNRERRLSLIGQFIIWREIRSYSWQPNPTDTRWSRFHCWEISEMGDAGEDDESVSLP